MLTKLEDLYPDHIFKRAYVKYKGSTASSSISHIVGQKTGDTFLPSVTNPWNSLPVEAVNVKSLLNLKST